MKVALISSFRFPIVQPYQGGFVAFIDRLARGLAQHGVDVVCYASEGSIIPDVEVRTLGITPTFGSAPVNPSATRNNLYSPLENELEQAAVFRAFVDAVNDRDIDLIHNNSFSAASTYAAQLTGGKPVIQTLHLPPLYPSIYVPISTISCSNIRIVCVSHQHAAQWTKYRSAIEVVLNGIPLDSVPEPTEHEGWFAFVGRIHPCKGIIDAIKVAVTLKKQLKIFGPPDAFMPQYYTKVIKPLVDTLPMIEYCGSLPHNMLYDQLRKAQALLFPIKWDEPFGYAAVEAMALGVPALAYNRGAAAEIIQDNLTGTLIEPDNLSSLQCAARQSDSFDRANCASATRKMFDQNRNTGQYIEMYSTSLKVN